MEAPSMQVFCDLLTFLPACRRASANSVVMVLLPTPPLPDSTNTTCLTWARFASHVEQRREG